MDERYMARCLELAGKGSGATAPNPMVGSVIIHHGRIIGEGYHRAFGEAHAEVNAIVSVRDPGLLAESTLYVNLEPCSHYGKTPPCSRLIIEKKIPRVVIGTEDPNPDVTGTGIRQLKENGLQVKTGVLEKECRELNRRFFTFQEKERPWILLKWARSEDGFIDLPRSSDNPAEVHWITGPEARQWVHKWRSEEQAILVGTRTAMLDDPELTVRFWKGRNPLRLVIDRKGELPGNLKIFNGKTDTRVFSSRPKKDREGLSYIKVPDQADYIPFIMNHLYESGILSLMVEGGASLLDSFIRSGLWDEARVFTGKVRFESGVPSPEIKQEPAEKVFLGDDVLEIYRNA